LNISFSLRLKPKLESFTSAAYHSLGELQKGDMQRSFPAIVLAKLFTMSKPAARISDMHICPMLTPGLPPIPHVGGPITGPGCPTVLIGGLPAAVVGDMCVCVGPPDSIVLGSMTVLIGGKPAVRMGDMTVHGGAITSGLPTVLIGG
jgi:uncharacterized Zn-binding protein involved in type VI secretion